MYIANDVVYFGNYKRLVYLAQSPDKSLRKKAERAASKLGLAFEYKLTGFHGISNFLKQNI